VEGPYQERWGGLREGYLLLKREKLKSGKGREEGGGGLEDGGNSWVAKHSRWVRLLDQRIIKQRGGKYCWGLYPSSGECRAKGQRSHLLSDRGQLVRSRRSQGESQKKKERIAGSRKGRPKRE